MPGLGALQALVAGLAMIGVLVVVHEFGHYLFARWFGIGAPVFSVGVGPRIWGFQWRGTDWRLSALPFGGYVRLAGADPFGEEDPDDLVDPDEDFMRKPVWQRLIVLAAGPVFNLLLPVALFTLVLMGGEPQPDNVVGLVEPGRGAGTLGFQPDDVVVAVDGESVSTWLDFLEVLGDRANTGATVSVLRDGQTRTLVIPPGEVPLGAEGYVDLSALGLFHSHLSSRVGVDDPTSPASRAGIQTGDAIVGVGPSDIQTWDALQAGLAGPGPHTLRLKRVEEGAVRDVEVTLARDPAWTPRPGDGRVDGYGLVPAVLFVGDVSASGAAAEAGVRANDRLWSVDGEPVQTWSDLVRLVGRTVDGAAGADARPRALELVVYRGGAPVRLAFTPVLTREVVMGDVRWRPVVGVRQFTDVYVDGETVQKYYLPWEALPRALEESRLVVSQTVQVFANLATGELKPAESLGGPVEIFRVAGEGARRGWFTFARLMGTISFSIGMMNFLPVPVLDGGQILFYAIEGIRGRPLSLELRERVQAVGVLVLVAVMLLVTVMDVSRWLGG